MIRAINNNLVDQCFDFCKEQAEIFLHNEDIKGIGIIGLSTSFMVGHIIIHYFKDKILKHMDENMYNKIYIITAEASFILNIGFMVWFILR